MIVFNLSCDHQHVFEGWFSSAADFESQRGRALVACPVCASTKIEKMLSAPRLNLGAAAPREAVSPAVQHPVPQGNRPQPALMGDPVRRAEVLEQLQSMWMEMAKEVIANTEDVGAGFAEEARRIHYKEAPERNIRGQTTADEASELAEEGIAFASFLLPAALKGSLQ